MQATVFRATGIHAGCTFIQPAWWSLNSAHHYTWMSELIELHHCQPRTYTNKQTELRWFSSPNAVTRREKKAHKFHLFQTYLKQNMMIFNTPLAIQSLWAEAQRSISPIRGCQVRDKPGWFEVRFRLRNTCLLDGICALVVVAIACVTGPRATINMVVVVVTKHK